MNNNTVDSNTGDVAAEEVNPRKQWETINDHLRQMHLWVQGGSNSPLSTSPAGHVTSGHSPVITRASRVHANQSIPLHRRSDGVLHSRLMELQSAPQSAPILPEDFELWSNSPAQTPTSQNRMFPNIESHSPVVEDSTPPYHAPVFTDELHIHNRERNTSYNLQPDKHMAISPNQIEPSHELPHSNHQFASSSQIADGSYARPSKLHTSASTPMMLGFVSQPSSTPYDSGDKIHSSYNKHQHVNAAMHRMSPSTGRRKSAPAPEHVRGVKFAAPRRTYSQLPPNMVAPVSVLPLVGFHVKPSLYVPPDHLNAVDENLSASVLDVGEKNEDKEYTIALLQHQTDRMQRLEAELELKKKELALLNGQVNGMEMTVAQQHASTSTSAAGVNKLQSSVAKLRDLNRKLEIECNCMYKEVELFSRDGDSTREDFYSRYNRNSIVKKSKKEGKSVHSRLDLPPPPVPPPQDVEEELKWRCSHCTFDNHAALNKCEMCEFSRDVQPGRARV